MDWPTAVSHCAIAFAVVGVAWAFFWFLGKAFENDD